VYLVEAAEQQLLPWAKHRGLIHVHDLTVPELVAFRATWGNNGLTTNRKLTRLAGFFSFCIQNGWLNDNPALKIKRATVASIPTGGFPSLNFNGSLMRRLPMAIGKEATTSMRGPIDFAHWSC
jgi:hypothetical protein